MIFVSKNSAKALDFANLPPGGIGGPNIGTDLDRVTATLKEKIRLFCKMKILQDEKVFANFCSLDDVKFE